MNAVNAVQLFVLVWTFTVFCQADDDISVSCEDVTGTVREEVTFSCSVSLKKSECCITFYEFENLTKYNNSANCSEEFPQDSCEQRNSVTCSFTPTTAIMGKVNVFLQTNCGTTETEFTVNRTETSERKPVTEGPDLKPQILISPTVAGPGTVKGFESKNTVIAAVAGCFIFIVSIIMTIIYKKLQQTLWIPEEFISVR